MTEKSMIAGVDTATTYPRENLTTRIVHLGFGAFHRGHQALYNDLTNEASSQEPWGICEVNMFGPSELIDTLKQQDGLFTVVETSATESVSRVVRTVSEAIHTPDEGIGAAIRKMLEPQVSIVSLTVTEKGYCVNPQTRKLDLENPLIQHDLANPAQPKSAIGLIAEVLRWRMEKGLPAFSVMSCDNIPENGDLTRDAVIEYAGKVSPELQAWICSNVTFPNTMVDRIVPAMTEESYALIKETTGYEDPCGIVCESFRQWVVEDNFVAGRPEWEKAGAMLVEDVLPYEEMKLRMLNGSHSFLAYNGWMAGYDYIYQCMEDADFRATTLRLMRQEQGKSLSPTLDVDLKQYSELLIERFSNRNVKHKTSQIAMDGSQKLPQRAIDPMLELAKRGVETACLPTLIAGWMHFVEGKTRADEFELVDPLSDKIAAVLKDKVEPQEKFDALTSIENIFAPELKDNNEFMSAVLSAYLAIETNGIKAVVKELANS